jgi:hypothetical protein
MAMQYDVQAKAIAAGQTDAAVFASRSRIKGLVVSVPAGGGTLAIKDGAAGTTVFSFVAPAAAGTVNIIVPGEGILCETGIYVTTPASMTVTVFYG